jgi:hypothetical protein
MRYDSLDGISHHKYYLHIGIVSVHDQWGMQVNGVSTVHIHREELGTVGLGRGGGHLVVWGEGTCRPVSQWLDVRKTPRTVQNVPVIRNTKTVIVSKLCR